MLAPFLNLESGLQSSHPNPSFLSDVPYKSASSLVSYLPASLTTFGTHSYFPYPFYLFY